MTSLGVSLPVGEFFWKAVYHLYPGAQASSSFNGEGGMGWLFDK
jgi:hypothetical protein